jgi:hypothetical protein
MTLAHSSALAGEPCAGYSKFPTYIYYSAHEIPIATQSHQGHAIGFIKHSYARRSYSAPNPYRSTMRAFSPPPLPLALLAYTALSPPQPYSSPAPPLPAWRQWRGHGYWRADVRPTNLKTVAADPSTSSPATMMSRSPHATSRRGFGPPTITRTTTSFTTEVSPAWTPNILSLIGHQNLLYIHVNVD